MEKVKFIALTIELKKQLASEFSCTNAAINCALNFMSYSRKAQDIRKRAYELGGFDSHKMV